MLKNMVVSLPMEPTDNAFAEYSISLARAFDAHLAAVAFAYEDIPESAKTAKAKVAKFEEMTRGSGISTEARRMTASFAGMAELFARIARRFDLSVVRQAEADKATPDRLIIEAALFDSGRPVLVVPYRLRGGIKLVGSTMTRRLLRSVRCSGSGALTSKSFTRRSTGWWGSSASNAHWPGATSKRLAAQSAHGYAHSQRSRNR